MKFFDTHCHLAGDELYPKYKELIEAASKRGVQGFAVISAEETCLYRTHEIIEQMRKDFPSTILVHSTGMHPHEVEKITDELWGALLKCSLTANAIGETGLDYYYEHSPRDLQKEYFRKHIHLAKQQSKPLIIHCRQAADDVYQILHDEGVKSHREPGIFHCFAEDKNFVKKALDLGFYISFSGIVSFANAHSLREVAEYVPLDRMLIETDAPWLAPVPHRGKRNEPAFVADVFEAVSKLRKEDKNSLAEKIWENSLKVLGVAA